MADEIDSAKKIATLERRVAKLERSPTTHTRGSAVGKSSELFAVRNAETDDPALGLIPSL